MSSSYDFDSDGAMHDLRAHKVLSLPTPMSTAEDFLRESLAIESEWRAPTQREIDAYERVLRASEIEVGMLTEFVQVTTGTDEPMLRLHRGMDVRVGSYLPPRGGPFVLERLQSLLERAMMLTAYELYIQYEKLHPYMDGNGRSGRLVWHWRMRDKINLGFLREFHYQALRARNP